jgi:polyisoprenoid-binding protein YceI
MQTQTNLSERPVTANKAQTDVVERFQIDPAHASAQFKVRHLMVSNVRGELGAVSGELALNPNDLTRSQINLSIDVRGIDTRNADRDTHLRSPDFFDVAQYPSATFASTRIEARGGDEYEVVGELTLRGVTQPVTLAVELTDAVSDPWGNVKRGAAAKGRINRKDFGLNWNAAMEAGGVVVGEQVDVTIELELVRQSNPAS